MSTLQIQSWLQKHLVLSYIFFLVLFRVLLGFVGNGSPAVLSVGGLIFQIGLFIGIPIVVFIAAKDRAKASILSRDQSEDSKTASAKEATRQALLIVYALGLLVSFPIAFGSIFIFDGQSLLWARYGIFYSAIATPVTIVIAMLASKRSLRWLLLPLLPVATLFFFSHVLDQDMRNSDIAFCKDAIARNDRSILDDPTLHCNVILQGK